MNVKLEIDSERLLKSMQKTQQDATAAVLALLPELPQFSAIERYRREQPTLDATPLPSVPVDYAQAGTKIDIALHHLNEALPTGQRIRGSIAMRQLMAAVIELQEWMRAKGYDV